MDGHFPFCSYWKTYWCLHSALFHPSLQFLSLQTLNLLFTTYMQKEHTPMECKQEKKKTWTRMVIWWHLFPWRPSQVEKPSSSLRADRLIYPPLPSPVPKSSSTPSTILTTSNDMTTPVSSESMEFGQPSTKLSPLPVPKPQLTPKSPSAEPILSSPQQPIAIFPSMLLSLASACSPPGGLQLPPSANLGVLTVLNHKGSGPLPGPNCAHPAAAKAPSQASSLQPGTDILPLLKASFSPTSYNSAPCHPSKPSKPSTVVVEEETREKIKEIMSKHSRGLWAPALPKLFTDTYKTPFPEHIMDNLSLLLDICRVEYPMPHDKKKVRWNKLDQD